MPLRSLLFSEGDRYVNQELPCNSVKSVKIEHYTNCYGNAQEGVMDRLLTWIWETARWSVGAGHVGREFNWGWSCAYTPFLHVHDPGI